MGFAGEQGEGGFAVPLAVDVDAFGIYFVEINFHHAGALGGGIQGGLFLGHVGGVFRPDDVQLFAVFLGVGGAFLDALGQEPCIFLAAGDGVVQGHVGGSAGIVGQDGGGQFGVQVGIVGRQHGGSTATNGELFAVTPDMKIGVKIAADGLDGGFITVNRANGKAGVILSNTAIGGTVIVQDQHAKITDHLPMIAEE